MFTGLIQALGQVQAIEQKGQDCSLQIVAQGFGAASVKPGDSICVSGVCLTACDLLKDAFRADVSAETLSCTTLGQWRAGQSVNLEASLQPTSRLGGHFVSGHVDGIGTLISIEADGRSQRMTYTVPDELARYIASKGSICIDGISLTVNHVEANRFDVNIIPHTLQNTTLQDYSEGQHVNLEVDLIARYLERLMLGDAAAGTSDTGKVTRELLLRHGYLGGDQEQ